jgi:DNA-binding NtrC family response regulator
MLIRVFIVADNAAFERRAAQLLALPDLHIAGAARKRDLWRRMAQHSVDLVVASDTALPRPLPRTVGSLRALPERPDVVVLAAEENPERRAELLTAGCTAVLFSGLGDEVIRHTLAALVARRRDERPVRTSAATPARQPSLDDFGSSSPAMREILATARRVATSDTSLLILGETGVGKERLARAIHAAGARERGPFVAVNCAAIPEALLESELFGHERGAFTGAVRPRRGHFELAHRGTFLLDEIGDLPAHLQVKLLRVLQDHTIQPVGSERTIEVDVRVMAATSQDLEAAMAARRFRQDLYYRLSVVTLTIPALRERREDIPLLADAYREHFAARLGQPVTSISAEALSILTRHAWPGNVRELINVMERAVLLCSGNRIEAGDLASIGRGARDGDRAASLDALFELDWADKPWRLARQEALDVVERLYLSRVLDNSHGRVGEAARRAGLNPRSLFEKLQRHGLRKESYRQRGKKSGPQGP